MRASSGVSTTRHARIREPIALAGLIGLMTANALWPGEVAGVAVGAQLAALCLLAVVFSARASGEPRRGGLRTPGRAHARA